MINPFSFFKRSIINKQRQSAKTLAEKKALLRETANDQWFYLTKKARRRTSIELESRLQAYLNNIDAKTVLFYASMEDEPSTDEILQVWMDDPDKTLVLTRVCNKTKQLDPFIVTAHKDLEMGRFRIRMPQKTCQPIDLIELDAVVVPGRVFDTKKNRIGRGYGFYDRFLSVIPDDVAKIGVAFQFQMADTLPKEDHDIPMDVVITESKVYE